MTLAQDHPFLAGFSPNSSPDETSSILYDEAEDSKDLYDFDDISPLDAGGKPKKSNGRKGSGPGAADKRATHNAIERARRESLNGRFMTLAEALPSMASVKRPSKSIIVNKALDFVFEAQVKEHALIKENNELRLQVDQLRARLGMSPLPPPAPLLPEQTLRSAAARAAASQQAAQQQQQQQQSQAQEAPLPSPTFSQTSPATSTPIPMSSVTAPQPHHLTAAAHQFQPQQHSSPTSIFASPLAAADSPASSTTGSLDLASSMESLSPYAAASSITGAYGSSVPQFTVAQQHAALMQAHYGGPSSTGAYMGVNPSNLVSPQQQQQQQQLFFAAQLAQHHAQQQQQHHAHQQQQQQQHHLQQHQLDGFGGYNPLQPAFFMA